MMSDREVEHVLVVPTAVLHRAGLFQGFCTEVERYLPLLLDPAQLRYLPRPEAENDPSFKQLIPYVVLRHGSQLFHYTRGSSTGETRLRAKRSVGVGGHICAEDACRGPDVYRTGMQREVEEEIYLETTYHERCLGLINDDSTPVGQVHLGIVHLFDVAEARVRRREEGLTEAGFAPRLELVAQREQFETWSQLLLDGDWLR